MPARTSPRHPRPRRRLLLGGAAAIGLVLVSGLAPLAPPVAAAPVAPRGAPVACRAPEGAARYVRFVYRTILNRCPDPAGLAYWTRRLEAGASRWGVADAIDLSDENLRRNNVVPAYSFLVGRPPTAAELDRWVRHIRMHRENGVMNASLMASDEGFSRKVGELPFVEQDAAWVTWAYERILDRAPDPRGLAFYLGYFAPSGAPRAQRFKVAISCSAAARTRSRGCGPPWPSEVRSS
jgi:hypothetical protein